MRALAVAVDGFAAQGLATITETATALTIASLGAAAAETLIPLLTQLDWSFEVVDGAGESAHISSLTEDYAPFIVTVTKPAVNGGLVVVTLGGLRAFLAESRSEPVWHIVPLVIPFATMATDFRPWGSTGIFSPSTDTKSPRELVRENNVPPHAPADIRVWLLRGAASEEQWGEAAFQVFAELSARALMRALAGEIKADGSLNFKGPPLTQLDQPEGGTAKALELKGYNNLREAAAWVYENSVEAERRHGLFTAEFGATNPGVKSPALAFRSIVSNVLQGARLAYQLSLSDLTREAIKAQSDLRKAVADDTAKLADNTRQVATAVAAALATCVGLIAAKISTTTPLWVVQVVALVAAIYVGAVIASGWIFMSVQRDMRKKWRDRLYRFVPDPDYKAMVLDPARRAEIMFLVAAVAGSVIALLAVSLIFLLPCI